jgi:hypothetical protein
MISDPPITCASATAKPRHAKHGNARTERRGPERPRSRQEARSGARPQSAPIAEGQPHRAGQQFSLAQRRGTEHLRRDRERLPP